MVDQNCEMNLCLTSRQVPSLLQIEREVLEPAYEFLKEQNFRNLYIQPEEKEIERYICQNESAIILKTLISKSPTQRVDTVITVTLEKLLVDLYCDKKLFAAFQGSELIPMVKNAQSRYSINFTKLLGYAKRRRKETEIMEFISARTKQAKTLNP